MELMQRKILVSSAKQATDDFFTTLDSWVIHIQEKKNRAQYAPLWYSRRHWF